MLNITHYQRNANQNHNEVPLHASQVGCYPKVYKQEMLERVQRMETLLHYWWECKLVQPLWRTVWNSLKILYDPIPECISRKTENLNSKRYTHPYVHSNAIFNSQNTDIPDLKESRVPHCSSQHCLS